MSDTGDIPSTIGHSFSQIVRVEQREDIKLQTIFVDAAVLVEVSSYYYPSYVKFRVSHLV